MTTGQDTPKRWSSWTIEIKVWKILTALRSVLARTGRQLGGGIIAANSLLLLLAWHAESLTADLLVSSVIASVLMAAVGALACAAPARRALRVQPALRQI